jgi:transposase
MTGHARSGRLGAKPGRRKRLTEAEQAVLAAHIFRGPDPGRDGVSAWRRADLCRWLEDGFAKTFHLSSLSRVLRRLELLWQKTRPVHPQANVTAQERLRKRGCAAL